VVAWARGHTERSEFVAVVAIKARFGDQDSFSGKTHV
jgi:hypothetical protein